MNSSIGRVECPTVKIVRRISSLGMGRFLSASFVFTTIEVTRSRLLCHAQGVERVARSVGSVLASKATTRIAVEPHARERLVHHDDWPAAGGRQTAGRTGHGRAAPSGRRSSSHPESSFGALKKIAERVGFEPDTTLEIL